MASGDKTQIYTKPQLDNLLNRLAELNFFKKLAFNKDLLLFCQRRFLDKEFDKKIFMLDDTNIPFDYDHLFPQSYIKNKKGIKKKKTLKDWYNSIGNLRAWPYDKNKKDSDKPPYEKLKDSFLEDSCCSKKWIKEKIKKDEIKEYILDLFNNKREELNEFIKDYDEIPFSRRTKTELLELIEAYIEEY